MTKFPHWVPREGIHLYEFFLEKFGEDHFQTQALFNIFGPEMEWTWGRITLIVEKRSKKDYIEKRSSKASIFNILLRVIDYSAEPTDVDKMTPLAYESWISNIEKKSSDLADLIASDDHLDTVFLDNLWDDHMEGHYPWLSAYVDDEVEEGGKTRPSLPSLSTILLRLTDMARTLADTPQTRRPNANEAHHTIFVRRMSLSFKEYLGSPHRALVAELTNAIFKTHLNEDSVRKLCRQQEPSN